MTGAWQLCGGWAMAHSAFLLPAPVAAFAFLDGQMHPSCTEPWHVRLFEALHALLDRSSTAIQN